MKLAFAWSSFDALDDGILQIVPGHFRSDVTDVIGN